MERHTWKMLLFLIGAVINETYQVQDTKHNAGLTKRTTATMLNVRKNNHEDEHFMIHNHSGHFILDTSDGAGKVRHAEANSIESESNGPEKQKSKSVSYAPHSKKHMRRNKTSRKDIHGKPYTTAFSLTIDPGTGFLPTLNSYPVDSGNVRRHHTKHEKFVVRTSVNKNSTTTKSVPLIGFVQPSTINYTDENNSSLPTANGKGVLKKDNTLTLNFTTPATYKLSTNNFTALNGVAIAKDHGKLGEHSNAKSIAHDVVLYEMKDSNTSNMWNPNSMNNDSADTLKHSLTTFHSKGQDVLTEEISFYSPNFQRQKIATSDEKMVEKLSISGSKVFPFHAIPVFENKTGTSSTKILSTAGESLNFTSIMVNSADNPIDNISVTLTKFDGGKERNSANRNDLNDTISVAVDTFNSEKNEQNVNFPSVITSNTHEDFPSKKYSVNPKNDSYYFNYYNSNLQMTPTLNNEKNAEYYLNFFVPGKKKETSGKNLEKLETQLFTVMYKNVSEERKPSFTIDADLKNNSEKSKEGLFDLNFFRTGGNEKPKNMGENIEFFSSFILTEAIDRSGNRKIFENKGSNVSAPKDFFISETPMTFHETSERTENMGFPAPPALNKITDNAWYKMPFFPFLPIFPNEYADDKDTFAKHPPASDPYTPSIVLFDLIKNEEEEVNPLPGFIMDKELQFSEKAATLFPPLETKKGLSSSPINKTHFNNKRNGTRSSEDDFYLISGFGFFNDNGDDSVVEFDDYLPKKQESFLEHFDNNGEFSLHIVDNNLHNNQDAFDTEIGSPKQLHLKLDEELTAEQIPKDRFAEKDTSAKRMITYLDLNRLEKQQSNETKNSEAKNVDYGKVLPRSFEGLFLPICYAIVVTCMIFMAIRLSHKRTFRLNKVRLPEMKITNRKDEETECIEVMA